MQIKLAIQFLALCLSTIFVETAGAVQWRAVNCAPYASAAITTQGKLFVTGENDQGELGDGQSGYLPGYRKQWTLVATKVASVTLGREYSAFIDRSGKLWATGNNDYGQLGTGGLVSRKRWRRTLTDTTNVYQGYKQLLALRNDASLWVTGISEQGNRNSSGYFYVPNWAQTLNGVRSAAGGHLSAYAINDRQELLKIRYPVGSQPPVVPPQWEKLEEGVRSVTYYSPVIGEVAVLKTDETVWWSYDLSGLNFQLIASGIEQIKGSQQGLLLLDKAGTLFLWTASRPTLTPIHQEVADFCAGAQHALVVKADGSLWASGINNRGQFGMRSGKGTSSLQEWVRVKLK